MRNIERNGMKVKNCMKITFDMVGMKNKRKGR